MHVCYYFLVSRFSLEIIFIHTSSQGLSDGESRIMVKLVNQETGNRWLLAPDRFVSALLLLEFHMQHVVGGCA